MTRMRRWEGTLQGSHAVTGGSTFILTGGGAGKVLAFMYDDRMDGHAKEAIKKWQATTTLLQLRGETSDHPTGQAS